MSKDNWYGEINKPNYKSKPINKKYIIGLVGAIAIAGTAIGLNVRKE